MRQIKISMDDGGVRTLNEVKYISELRKNLIFLSTLQTNGFSYKSYKDRDNMKISKGALIVMGARDVHGQPNDVIQLHFMVLVCKPNHL